MKTRSNYASSIDNFFTGITWAVLASSFLLATLIRSRVSIKYLPPDPGLDFQILAKSDGLTKIFSSYNGYPQVLPRLISEVLNLVPLSQLTFWSTLLNAFLSLICALAITRALLELVGTKSAILVGLVLSIAFTAHEGLIGNVWAIRWTLLPATCIVASIPNFSQKYWRFSLLLFLATGLSHAYIFVPTCVFLIHAILRREYQAKTFTLGTTLVLLTFFQGYGYLNSSRQLQLYGEDTVYWPWKDSGVYWWATFSVPLIFALVGVATNLRPKIPSITDFTPKFSIAFQAALISVLSYLQLGIKSSPAVATVTLSFAAVMVGGNKTETLKIKLRTYKVLKVVCSLLLIILSVRFYFPSYFLTNGAGWDSTVKNSLMECENTPNGSTDLVIFQINDLVQSENVTCSSLKTWDKWFFQR